MRELDPKFNRVDPRAGWTDGRRRPCRECGAEPPRGRRTFCSDECVDRWKVRTDPGHAARLVLARDHGVCAECTLDCIALLAELKRARRETRQQRGHFDCDPTLSFELKSDHPFGIRLAEIGLTGARAGLGRRLWEMDHIVPVVEGGGSCGLDNLRTLCWRCHRAATSALRARLAAARKASP